MAIRAEIEALSLDIIARHRIRPERVLAHSDVAPARKRDPGEKFDWGRLGGAGIGLWREPAMIEGDAGFGRQRATVPAAPDRA